MEKAEGQEAGHECGGRGLEFIPKAVRRQRRIWTRDVTSVRWAAAQSTLLRGYTVHRAPSHAVLMCWFIHYFMHAAHRLSTHHVPNIPQG